MVRLPRMAGQGGGFTAIEFSKLGHLRQQQCSCAWADPSYGSELPGFAAEFFGFLDQLL